MLGKVTTAVFGLVLILSVGAVGYFLFQAPLWCGAITRDGTLCRNNSSGLLIGCHLREHKWQKLKMAFIPKAWRELNRGLWATPREGLILSLDLARPSRPLRLWWRSLSWGIDQESSAYGRLAPGSCLGLAPT